MAATKQQDRLFSTAISLGPLFVALLAGGIAWGQQSAVVADQAIEMDRLRGVVIKQQDQLDIMQQQQGEIDRLDERSGAQGRSLLRLERDIQKNQELLLQLLQRRD